ncbi:MAG: hypothetical protein A2901_07290 [Elusimicrobia bacterium RIFCSPLOWO2_01_FULL_54_10]|nr:MAG: hypothetical protein A2901_07290 [Elusimicrobia bacterium RIFCSPLOWO2_01_FULL_54_10]
MNFQVEFRPEVHSDLDRIPKNVQVRIKKAIATRLEIAPQHYGERLRRSLLGLWKLRVGDYRVVYELQNSKVTIWMIAHRKEVYEEIGKRWSKYEH